MADPERLARVEREARLLAALDHPHIRAIDRLETLDTRTRARIRAGRGVMWGLAKQFSALWPASGER
jgi:hypothetical protein